jgi:hypothetical protein
MSDLSGVEEVVQKPLVEAVLIEVNNPSEALVMEKTVGFRYPRGATQQSRGLLGHCDEQIALIEDESVGNVSGIELPFLALISVAAFFVEAAWRHQNIRSIGLEIPALERIPVLHTAEVRQFDYRPTHTPSSSKFS